MGRLTWELVNNTNYIKVSLLVVVDEHDLKLLLNVLIDNGNLEDRLVINHHSITIKYFKQINFFSPA